MSGFLLDTNILSELRKQNRCNAGVQKWFIETADADLFISVLVLGEIRQGIERIRPRDRPQALALEQWLQSISTTFADRILPVDERVADQWGRLGVRQPLPLLDALLAATALVHDQTLVTRNVGDIAHTGVQWINPFSVA
jgi:predicted nucleic acid-binding protein